jgi:DNA polymerase III alpha subunit
MDIDIDFGDRTSILDIIQHIPASLDGSKRHNTGIYCHAIPTNPLTGAASIDYRIAESRGYFKIDFLNVGIYKDIKNDQHLEELMNTEPLWELLEQDDFVDLLFHVNGHGNLLRQTKPKNIEQLAAVLAIIRPAKRYLVEKNWDTILKEVWVKPTNGDFYFKKSHALSYAMAVMIHMNLICEKISYGYS